MICAKCEKDKPLEDFGLRGGVRFKQCKRCCSMASAAARRLRESRNPQPTVVAGWPWVWNGLVYGEDRV